MVAQPPGHQFISFLFFFSLFFTSKSNDLQTLLSIKSSFINTPTHIFDTWIPENPICNFTGLVCDSNQLVTEINLSQENISGTLPFESICSLKSLQKLSFGGNYLYGNLTDHLKNCTTLEYLDLGCNTFSGKVPDLSSLSQLKFLNLNYSGFSGQFPWTSLENLTSLTFLSLGDNPFDTNPFPVEVLRLEKLYWLYLSNCSIKGQIPEGIANLTLLENLELSANQMFGPIPSGITKLVKLHQLELYNNSLTGKLPVGIGNLTNLAYFDVSTNKLEGDVLELKSLTRLVSLQLFENRFSGEIPNEFGDLKYLTEFSIYTNNFTGSLPRSIGSWADFLYIDVSENYLSGPIPPDMCKNGKLFDLLILQNMFTGGIPETYVQCSSLVRLRINSNLLSGVVPAGIWSLPEITIIDLTSNQFEGPVTPNIGEAKSLAQLYLADNWFSGELPENISQVLTLVAINLSSNQFSGQLPKSIGELKKLSSVHLENNQFSGTIPDSLGSCNSLDLINLAGNSLSGEIPGTLGSLPSLNSLNLSDNKLSGEIPESLSQLRLTVLDLSDNRLVGPVPSSLSIDVFSDSFVGNPGLCSQSMRNLRPCSSDSSMSNTARTLIFCFVAGASVFLFSLACFVCVKFKRKNQDHPIKRHDSWDMKPFHVISFSEAEVLNAVKQENLIGKGGSGNVYRVALGNGKQLAVKHIWKLGPSDWDSFRSTATMLEKGELRSPEYDAEVATLSSIRHVNVVKLYCSITSEDSNLLVYEYLPNGSLWDRLHASEKIEMDWMVRYEIAVGAARGLEYLHHGCDRPVIHRDVKSSNILLDEHMKPRIADFGLAKFVQAKANGARDSTHIIAGTLGYIAPEYAYTSKVNEKSDVYSYGVVLMELVTGKKPVEPEFGENKDIVQWICCEMRSKGNVLDLVDPSISKALKEDAEKVLRIAIHCTTRTPSLRPSMRMVVEMLEDAKTDRFTSIVVNKEG